MTEQDRQAFDPRIEPWHTGSCQGPCQQGRKRCPTPQACQLDMNDPADKSHAYLGAAIALSAVLVLTLFCAALQWI